MGSSNSRRYRKTTISTTKVGGKNVIRFKDRKHLDIYLVEDMRSIKCDISENEEDQYKCKITFKDGFTVEASTNGDIDCLFVFEHTS